VTKRVPHDERLIRYFVDTPPPRTLPLAFIGALNTQGL
jgi:hypothetical protein